MRTKEIDGAGERTLVAVLDPDDEVIRNLTELADEQALGGSRLTAIGGFSRATLGFFDTETKGYLEIAVEEQTEVASLVGSITRDEELPKMHLHAVLSKRDGSTVGGHVLEGWVRPTLEVMTSNPWKLSSELMIRRQGFR